MSNFDQRNQNVNKQINVNQTNVGISPDEPQKLGEIQKVYHWANLILVPIVLLVLLKVDNNSSAFNENIYYIGLGYLVISGLINDMTRGWLFKFFEVVLKTGVALGWVGPVGGVILLFILVLVLGVVGVLVLSAALWIISLVAIIQDNSSQTDIQ